MRVSYELQMETRRERWLRKVVELGRTGPKRKKADAGLAVLPSIKKEEEERGSKSTEQKRSLSPDQTSWIFHDGLNLESFYCFHQ